MGVFGFGDSLAAQAGTATSRCRDARTEEGMKARALLVRRCRLLAFSFCRYLHVHVYILADALFPSNTFLFSHWRDIGTINTYYPEHTVPTVHDDDSDDDDDDDNE